MTDLKIPRHGWVVVCDGSRALFLANGGDEFRPALETRHQMEQEVPANTDVGTDRPGRVHQSVGPSRSAVEETDWHDQQEEAFLAAVAEELERLRTGNTLADLIVVAPPRALGVLRAKMREPLRRLVIGEVDKDYVRLPVAEIEKRLTA